MNTPADRLKNRFVKSEPALAASAAFAVVGFVLTTLTTHGVITSEQASSFTKVIVPPVTAALIVAFGFVLRVVVSPAAAFADRVQGEVETRVRALTVTDSIPVPDPAPLVTGNAAPKPSPRPTPEPETVDPALDTTSADTTADVTSTDTADVSAALAAADGVYPATAPAATA